MTVEQRRIKVLEKLLDDAISDQLAIEIGVEVKQSLLLMMPNHPQAAKVEEAIQQSQIAIQEQKMAINIMQRKLEEEQKSAA